MLLALQNLSFSFGARTMLEEVNWQINEGERIGLVGPNGAGKSTLLRLIMGEYKPESGAVVKANNVSLGFFNQDLLSFSSDDTILNVGMGAFEEAKAIEAKLELLAKELEIKSDDEALLLDYSHALHDYEVAGGYEMEHKTAQVLEGLGFTTEQLQKPYNLFSGGWRMRVLLAKMMLQQPDILMLDEPTNHLDLPSIEWLEKYLISYPGTVIIVSHDRYFLDRMVTTVAELFMQDIHVYSGNYTFYQLEKATRLSFLEREYENQQKFIKQQERFIERFKAKASKATQAQSAMKRLDKMDKIELPDANLPKMNINFEVGTQPGKIIAEIKNLSKSYPGNPILWDTEFEINRGDKIALVGANGKGKSTVLRIIGDIEQYEGERSGGHNVELSFYAQHQLESLDLEESILDEMKMAGTGKNELELRQLLGCFIFTGDDVFKKIKILSGGEKARVALAKVIASKSNTLLLDEPTNHLDIQSVELLIEALQQYEGTYVIVSHDRYFVSKTANQFWEIVDGKIKVFKGTYDEWEVWKQEQANSIIATPKKDQAKPNPVAKTQAQETTKSSNTNNARLKDIQNAERKVKSCEEKLAAATSKKDELELALSQPDIYSDKQKFADTEKAYQDCVKNVESCNIALDKALEELIALEG